MSGIVHDQERVIGEQVDAAEDDASAPWARQPGENERWYGRFTLYRLLGSRRSLQRAYDLARVLEGLRGQSPGQAWEQKAQEFAWPARAALSSLYWKGSPPSPCCCCWPSAVVNWQQALSALVGWWP